MTLQVRRLDTVLEVSFRGDGFENEQINMILRNGVATQEFSQNSTTAVKGVDSRSLTEQTRVHSMDESFS